jgi:hypothetical protein
MKKEDFSRLQKTVQYYKDQIANFPASERAERKPRSKAQLQARLAAKEKELREAKSDSNET